MQNRLMFDHCFLMRKSLKDNNNYIYLIEIVDEGSADADIPDQIQSLRDVLITQNKELLRTMKEDQHFLHESVITQSKKVYDYIKKTQKDQAKYLDDMKKEMRDYMDSNKKEIKRSIKIVNN